jgi:hypothetical protein
MRDAVFAGTRSRSLIGSMNEFVAMARLWLEGRRIPAILAFDFDAVTALHHYEVGVRIGELSLGDSFDGVLSWGWIDNRPFLRCLSGYGLCLWRQGRFDEAGAVFERLLWLSPSDNQGIRFLLDPVRRHEAWRPE